MINLSFQFKKFFRHVAPINESGLQKPVRFCLQTHVLIASKTSN